MESRRVSRKSRCAKSCPGSKVEFQFVNVTLDDQGQQRKTLKTLKIVRANAAHFHWRHNRLPRDKAELKGSDDSIISYDSGFSRPSSPLDIKQLGIDVDPFSPYFSHFPRAIVNHCIAFNAQFILPALFPDDANHFQVRSNLVQMATSNKYVLHMFLTGTLSDTRGKLGATPSDRVALDIFRSRAEIVRNLSVAMNDPIEQFKDINILAILALAKIVPFQKMELPPKTPKQGPLKSLQLLDSFSLSNIDPLHVDGLKRLIELKGGLEEIETPGLAPVISLGDILAGSRNCTAPHFPMATISCPTNDFVFHSQGMPGFGTDQDLYMVISMLRDYTMMIGDHCEGRQILTASVLIDHRNTMQHALLSLPPRSGTSECYRLVALIYSLLVTFPLPYNVAPFKYLVTQLMEALSDWDGDDDMLLWVLTLGGIGAVGLNERLWFMSNLESTAARIGIFSWGEARHIMSRGLWHEATNEGDGRDIWVDSGMVE